MRLFRRNSSGIEGSASQGAEAAPSDVAPISEAQPAATAPADAAATSAATPATHYCCPISMELMNDPVVLATGAQGLNSSVGACRSAAAPVSLCVRVCLPARGRAGSDCLRLRSRLARLVSDNPFRHHLRQAQHHALAGRRPPHLPQHGRAFAAPGVGAQLRAAERNLGACQLCPFLRLFPARRSPAAPRQEWAEAHHVTMSEREATEPGVPARLRAPDTASETQVHHVLQGHDEIVWAVEVAAGRLYSASADRTIRVWDTASRRCVAVLEDHTRPVLALALSSTHLFSGSYDASVRVWDLRTLRRAATLTGHTDAVRALVTVPAARAAFSASYDCTLRAWCLDSLTPRGVLTGHSGPVRALAAIGTRLFSASYDRTVRCWCADTLSCLGVMEGHREAVRALTVCGEHLLASGSDDWTVRLWDARSLACVAVCEGHDDNVRVLAASATHLFSGSWDKTVRCWSLAPDALGRCAAMLSGHHEAVLALTVVRGHVVSGSFDASVRFWSAAQPGFPCVAKCEGHEDAVRVLASTGENAELCFSGSYDGCIGFLRAPPCEGDAAPGPEVHSNAVAMAALLQSASRASISDPGDTADAS